MDYEILYFKNLNTWHKFLDPAWMEGATLLILSISIPFVYRLNNKIMIHKYYMFLNRTCIIVMINIKRLINRFLIGISHNILCKR